MYKTSNKSNKKKRIIERLEPKYFIIRNSLIGESKKKKKRKRKIPNTEQQQFHT